jgi:predicted neuraminidase
MIVERKDGSLLMLARTSKGIVETTSPDKGHTWSTPEPSAIINPNARFHIRRLLSGRILLVKNWDTTGGEFDWNRNKLSAWLSEDEGKTWKGGLVIEDRNGVSYPDGFQTPDGTIYISYDRQRSEYGEVLMARITEDDILSGTLINPSSKLKMIIYKPGKAKKQ